jgi:hypothetical protein
MPHSNRRDFLHLAGTAPLAFLALGSAAQAAEAAACFDPEMLPASQKNMRRSLGFTAVSTDPAKSCGGCAFFTGTAGGCGKCQLLTGGPVSATSVCRSWAKKA